MARQPDINLWWNAQKGSVSSTLFQHVADVESRQSKTFEKFVKLAFLYSQNGSSPQYGARSPGHDSGVVENYIASNVDTVHAQIATTSVRARFMTDGADWSTQRRAKHQEYYVNGLGKKLKAQDKGRRAFKDSALKGVGLVKIWNDRFNQINVKRLMVDNVVVDETDSREGQLPASMHYREIVSAEEAKSRYPGHDEAIDRAVGSGPAGHSRFWADYRPLGPTDVVLIEAWHLPLGVKGKKGYRPGRHVVSVEGQDLLDEKYEKPHYPIVAIHWSDPDSGWYGIGLAERIASIQNAANRLNAQKDRLLDRYANPITYVRQQDAKLAVSQLNRAGAISVYKSEMPHTVIPPSISPEVFNRHSELRQLASFESGVSQMAAHSAKPAGIDSGVALREYRDQTTQRFAQQEARYEAFILTIYERILECAKELGDAAPEVVRRSRFGAKKIRWADVDMGDVAVQIAASSDLSKTPSGRLQLALEWAQAGVISKDEARRLSEHPDTERSMSLYTAALEHIDRVLEDGLDGHVIMPDPYMNLAMCVWRGEAQLQIADDDGAPDEILDILRQFTDMAAWMLSEKEAGMAANETLAGPELTGAGVLPDQVA